jgi:integrase
LQTELADFCPSGTLERAIRLFDCALASTYATFACLAGCRIYATRLLRNGAAIEQVQLLLGHESIDHTDRYIDVSDAEISRAFRDVV